MQVLKFPKGNLYVIVCKGNEQSLKIPDPNSADHSKIVSTKPNYQDIGQLWFIERINNDEYEIVNAMSGYCFEEESKEIHLRPGKQNSDQLFWLEQAPISQYYPYYWIKTSKTSDKAIVLEGILRYKTLDINEPYQLFRFQPVTSNTVVNSTTIIINVKSGKALDVPGGSHEKGQRIIQYTRNKRFNQRWKFIKTGNSYQIQSLKNGLNLDISGEEKKPNSKVIQWEPTGKSNQLWNLETRNNGFVIRSVHEASLILGIKDDNLDDGGKLAIVNHDTVWRLEGFIPH